MDGEPPFNAALTMSLDTWISVLMSASAIQFRVLGVLTGGRIVRVVPGIYVVERLEGAVS